ncbi:hypothetical protein FNH05_06565 [Amycolatopsis rhizosphaerae]|uniref:ImmA/IrrE family metallo-endopeptidase n=1 Tax=Amycolatopsis rhizosphaerae TaxID=2053003 RepID=A0A558DBS2_9PSEU|nr:hypothetical protein FNH05_06565 [Amycolatopsis rhizosphaerae]
MPMPVPFDQDRFLAGIAELRGRPIEVLPSAVEVPCGLLVSTDATDYILAPGNTSSLHRQHIVFHEIAHLLCGHGDGVTVPAPVLPGLPADLVRRVLGRSAYTDPQEREAELVATFLTQRLAGPAPREYSGELKGLGEAFGGPSR